MTIHDLGNIKGEKGDNGTTYRPTITYDDDGKPYIKWDSSSTPPENTPIPFVECEPIIDERNYLKFEFYLNNNKIYETEPYYIKGKDGALHIKTIDASNPNWMTESDIDDLEKYIYFDTSENKLYVYDIENNELNDISVTGILTDYYNKEQIDNMMTNIKNRVDICINTVLNQLYDITSLIGDDISSDEIENNDNTMNIVATTDVDNIVNQVIDKTQDRVTLTKDNNGIQFTAIDIHNLTEEPTQEEPTEEEPTQEEVIP